MADPLEHADLIPPILTRFRSRQWRGQVEHADLEQAAWLGLIRAAKDFDGRGDFRGYAAARIWQEVSQVIRACAWITVGHDRGRRALNLERRPLEDSPIPAQQDEPTESPEVSALLSALPARQREVLDLRLGLSGGGRRRTCVVAEMLGIHESSVRTHERKALARLRTQWQRSPSR